MLRNYIFIWRHIGPHSLHLIPSAIISIIKFETVPTLEHRNSVSFSSILKRWVCFEKPFELSTSICNQNFSIFCRWRVTLISVDDIIFEGDGKLNSKIEVVCDPPLKICSYWTFSCSHQSHLSLGWAYRTPTAIGGPHGGPKMTRDTSKVAVFCFVCLMMLVCNSPKIISSYRTVFCSQPLHLRLG